MFSPDLHHMLDYYRLVSYTVQEL